MEFVLKRASVDDFEDIYKIMEESFPSDERRNYEEQKKLFSDPVYNIYVIKKENVRAFISVFEFDQFTFAEHFAVALEYRNCGLGSKVLSLLKKEVKSPICLEVELPETEIAKRRIEFYKRNGFFYNDYEYIQPAYSDEKNPVPLRIMTTEGEISEEIFKNVEKELYKNVYKVT